MCAVKQACAFAVITTSRIVAASLRRLANSANVAFIFACCEQTHLLIARLRQLLPLPPTVFETLSLKRSGLPLPFPCQVALSSSGRITFGDKVRPVPDVSSQSEKPSPAECTPRHYCKHATASIRAVWDSQVFFSDVRSVRRLCSSPPCGSFQTLACFLPSLLNKPTVHSDST